MQESVLHRRGATRGGGGGSSCQLRGLGHVSMIILLPHVHDKISCFSTFQSIEIILFSEFNIWHARIYSTWHSMGDSI